MYMYVQDLNCIPRNGLKLKCNKASKRAKTFQR